MFNIKINTDYQADFHEILPQKLVVNHTFFQMLNFSSDVLCVSGITQSVTSYPFNETKDL